MSSQEVMVKIESLQSEGVAARADELSGESLETSLAQFVEAEAKDEEKTKDYQCKVCKKIFKKFQSLGGHMNKHPEERFDLRLEEYERYFLKRMNSRSSKTMNPREYTPGTSSYSFNNLIQQSQQQMEPSQVWQAPMDPQQLSWPQVSANEINSAEEPASYFTVLPNTSNLPPTYVASDATVGGYYGPPSTDSSLYGHSSEEYNNFSIPSSTPSDALYGYSAPYTHPVPRSLSSNSVYDNFAPCSGLCCNNSSANAGPYQDLQVNAGPYQVPQVNLYTLEQGKGSSSTLDWNHPSSLMPPNMQMNDTSYAEGLHTSEVGTQETIATQDTEDLCDPSKYTHASESFHY